MKYLLYILIAGTFICLLSCNKYLDVEPKGFIIPTTTDDYEAILKDASIVQSFPSEVIYATDDIGKASYNSSDRTTNRNIFYWEEFLDANLAADPAIWKRIYAAVYSNNIVINEVLSIKEGSETKKKELYAEALVNRAESYFQLMNYYSPIYDSAKANTDLSIPLMTNIDIGDPVPPRATTAQCVDTIIDDIKTAIPLLPDAVSNIHRVSKYVAYGLLSRVYLSLYKYADALHYANLALGMPHKMIDYNYYDYASLPDADRSTDQLWGRYSGRQFGTHGLILSDDLVSYFDVSADLRYSNFIGKKQSNYLYYNSNSTYSTNMGITFAEVYLTQAECMARAGKINEAMTVLNEFRKNRIKKNKFKDLTAATADEAINAVLAERRRELMFKVTRWMDMRRLCKDGRMKDVIHINTGVTPAETIILPVNSPKYAFQIPISVLNFNPGMPRNPRN